MALRISSELHAELLARAAASPDAEICGLLIGESAVERIVPAQNVAADARIAFEIDPSALFAAMRAERAGGGRLIGYYHSHPVGPPTPSARDLEHVEHDGRIWLIIGRNTITVWVAAAHRQLQPIDIVVTP